MKRRTITRARSCGGFDGILREACVRRACIAIILGAIAAVDTASGQVEAGPIAYRTFDEQELRRDFDQFRNVVESQHPKVFTDRVAWQTAVEQGRASLRDGMNELEFFRLLSPLVARLNCGHTYLQLSADTDRTTREQRRYVPLVVQILEGRLNVVHRPEDSPVRRGSEIVSINGRAAADIIAQLQEHVPADGFNRTRKVKFINRNFGEYFHHHIDDRSTFVLEVIAPGSTAVERITLEGIDPTHWSRLWPADGGEDVEMISHAFANDHARLTVRSFNFYDTGGMQRFRTLLDEFFAELAARGTSRLVLDLRGNGGGEPRLGAYLLSYLIERPVLYFADDAGYYPTLRIPTIPQANAFSGELYVLIDGDVFSTNGHLVSLLEHHRIGRLIGEETGGSATCTANNRNVTLTHTRLRFSYATSTFTTAVEDSASGRGVFPDEEVKPALTDVLGGWDLGMHRALAHFRDPVPAATIVVAPQSQTVQAGGRVSLLVEASGEGPFLYQWRHDGRPLTLEGADTPLLMLPSFGMTDEGEYDVVVTNVGGAVTSAPARLRRGEHGWSRPVNLSTRAYLAAADDVLIAGLVVSGDVPATVLIRGVGPGLAALDVEDALASPELTLYRGGEVIARNTGWYEEDPERIRQVSARVGAFALPEHGRDCVLLRSLDPGDYTVHLRTADGAPGTAIVEVYDAMPGTGRVLINLSARARLTAGGGPLISGLVINGDAPQTVLVRVIGPGLGSQGVQNVTPDPRFTLYVGSTPVLTGRALADSPQRTRSLELAQAVGAFELGEEARDAVLVVTLQPGLYTLVGTGSPGEILTEVYAVPAHLVSNGQ